MSGTIMYPTDGKNPYAFPKTFKEWSESVKDAWIYLATHSDFIPEGHTQVLVIRPNEGYGNSFNSLRVAIKNDSGSIKVFTEMVGANAKESMAKKYEGMTRPDGDYYYTTKPLYPQNDGTYNSNSFINVLREVTNDPRIPENVRNSINNGDYLSHSSQKGKIVYTTPLSAGCTVSNGQKAQNQYIKFISPHVNTDGIVDNISIKYISGVY